MTAHHATCRSVREWIGAYLDGELPANRAEEIRRHLEICPSCERLAGRERSVRTLLRVRRNSLAEPTPGGLRAAVLDGLDRVDEGCRTWRRRIVVACVTAAALVVLSFGVGRLYSVWSPEAGSVAAETVDEHIRCLMGSGIRLDVTTSDPEAASEWFRGKLDIRVAVPDFARAGLLFRGGRLCYLLDRRIAYLMYEDEGNRYSLFVMDPSGVRFPSGRDVTIEGRKICLTSRKGYHLAVWEAIGLIYALVASERPERLAEIAAAAPRS